MTPPRLRVLAADYDGTLADHGVLEEATAAALERLRAAGWKLLLVTGRQLDDLRSVCPRLPLFDGVVAENGALLHLPASDSIRELAAPLPPTLPAALRRRGVEPLSVGRVIVATLRPHLAVVRQTLAELGLEMELSLNRDALMVLPAGVDKGAGVEKALAALGLTTGETIGFGDAENDLPLLARCRVAVAVGNALPPVKEAANIVTAGAAGAGVREVVARLLAGEML
ncbi:MAG: HAD family phosphatase [Desulfuromonadales bacterium]|nr:HAD family phosphatase [Desulfuromonadales bacterium]